jgi:hypothetical protein
VVPVRCKGGRLEIETSSGLLRKRFKERWVLECQISHRHAMAFEERKGAVFNFKGIKIRNPAQGSVKVPRDVCSGDRLEIVDIF